MSPTPTHAATPAGQSAGALAAVGTGLLVLAIVTWIDALRLATSTGVGVGPSAAVKLVGTILAVLGIAHLVAAWRKRHDGPAVKDPDDVANHGALAWVLGGLFALIAAVAWGGGFVVGATLLFVATGRGFGRSLRSLAPLYGFVLSAAVYVFFTKVLSLALPAGPLERLLFS